MKILKEVETGNILKTTNEAAAEKVKTGLFRYSTKGRFKSLFKDLKRIKSRPKKKPGAFNSKKLKKLNEELETSYKPLFDEENKIKGYKRRVSAARNEQKQAEKRNKKRRNRRK